MWRDVAAWRQCSIRLLRGREMRRSRAWLTLLLIPLAALIVVGCVYSGYFANMLPTAAAEMSEIALPPGFRIAVYAAEVPNARQMALGPGGDVFVGSRSEGKVYAVVDRDGDNRADHVFVLASGLNQPSGVAFRDGALYVAAVSRVLRLLDLAGGRPEVVARGVRNSVGFDFDPASGELWFTDNGRDYLGDDSPPDELNHLTKVGEHFGFPFCHGNGIRDPELNAGRACGEFTPPARELGPHVAAIGMRFYTGRMFPEKYRGGVFIAEHGSWNRSTPIGYRVSFVKIENGRATSYEPFASGWLKGSVSSGRPADVLVMPDGALLVSDDKAGRIYRISYAGNG